MKKIREWSFPVALIVAWMIAAAYTLSLMIDVSDRNVPALPPVATSSATPAS